MAGLGAAVAIICSPSHRMLMIKRAVRAGDRWSGQIAFPGGHMEGEEEPLECAFREVKEEVGLGGNLLNYQAQLGDVSPLSNPEFLVRPFVFSIESEPKLTLNSEEVSEARWLDPDERVNVSLELPRGMVDGYTWGEWIVWGMSKRIIDEFLSEGVFLKVWPRSARS